MSGLLVGYFGQETGNKVQLENLLRQLGTPQNIKTTLTEKFAVAGNNYSTIEPCSLVEYNQDRRQLTLRPALFGAERLFYSQLGKTLWFSNQLRALLMLAPFCKNRQLNLAALHSYLAFSFVAAPHTLINGINIVPPNTVLTFEQPTATPHSYRQFEPPAQLSVSAYSETEWGEKLRQTLNKAVEQRLEGVTSAALHLSGGLDSAAIAALLVQTGIKPHLFHFDFGVPDNSERLFAEQTAAWLKLPLTILPIEIKKQDAARLLRRLVWDLGEPWGDPVTLPLYLGCQAVQHAGLRFLFNGEGGDQLFAGWPNRPMLTAELYGENRTASENYRLHSYLQTFHHFYGFEQALYNPSLLATTASEDLKLYVRPYLEETTLPQLFDRLRWANFWLKGSQNIMPRIAALGRQANLTLRTPFFDAELAKLALQIPSDLLLRGTTEKYLLKKVLAETNLLPPEILARPKRGMGVPVTQWCLAPLHKEVKSLLANLAKRGLFEPDYLKMLTKGQDAAYEIRPQRRVGEKIWQLVMLEIWLELFYDKFTLD